MVKKKIGNHIYRVIVILLAVIFAFPLFWTFTMSFKEREDIFTTTPPLLPTVWTMSNFREVFSTSGAVQFFKNSFLVSIMTTVLVVVLSTTCAFGLQRMAGKNSKRLSNSILMLRMIPVMVLTIPLYLIFRKLGWINSLPALTMCYVALSLPLAIWLCLGFYGGIPESIYEAAVMDGANELQLFKNIALPLISNSIVVVVLQTFFFAWNELALAMVLINKTENRTMAVGIKYWAGNTLETPFARMAAAGMVCIIPTVIITVFAQNYLVKGFVNGAVKG
ncbi:MAG TPA: carbohydrate ABC transporter permease [Candidatus Eisenbergiella intestinipullorum]|nr:carbohydrate ABC transporter permease [Candidatus Eisenbergiella intestinipullorum]